MNNYNNINPKSLVRVFVKGGVISPAELLRIMEASGKAGNSYVMFGSRQDILFPVVDSDEEKVRSHLDETGLKYNFTDTRSLKAPLQKENIVSSYVAVNITDNTWWLKEDIFHYVLDSFDYQPVLKVNIIDPIQSLVPLFTGHLNFIASKQEHYWHLFIRQPTENGNKAPKPWPALIHENEIANMAKEIERYLKESPGMSHHHLIDAVQKDSMVHSLTTEEEIASPTALFPYYEGLNAMQNNLFWLGLYWRNNCFDTEFLKEACRLCQDTKVGKISITPWKSFVIKGIHPKKRIHWEKLMGRFGINLRHSSLELNWHLPVMDEEALKLKTYLVRELDQQDISTHGLTFTIKMNTDMLLFTSVVIEKSSETSGLNDEPLFNILYSRDFNPNHSEYFIFSKQVEKRQLPTLLIKLSKIYFQQLATDEPDDIKTVFENKSTYKQFTSHQCSNCLTVYDKKYGEPDRGVKPGTPFDQLPGDYTCPLCSSAKTDFIPLVEY